MKFGFFFATAAVAALPSVASAQSTEDAAPGPVLKMNADHWTMVPQADDRFGLVHKLSGGICTDLFRDLKLVDVTSYTEDGNDVSCGYQKGSGTAATKLTTHFYRKPNLTGPIAFQQSVNGIKQIAQVTGLKAERNQDHSQRCYSAVAPLLYTAINGEPKEGDAASNNTPMGVAMYDYTFTPPGASVEVKQTSLITVYELDGWIIKTRFTAPASEGDESYANACNFSGLAGIATAKALRSTAPSGS